ncbi:hypothetical protein C8R45DRAFT_476934 [Mycena sanguinolenta]|nr:hypothetical protein C8R45DRAFT_476934 [Mycena sanguinolenta]
MDSLLHLLLIPSFSHSTPVSKGRTSAPVLGGVENRRQYVIQAPPLRTSMFFLSFVDAAQQIRSRVPLSIRT